MRQLLTLALAAGSLTFLRAVDDQPIPPDQAVNSVGKPAVLVEMLVKRAKDRLDKRGIIYLDSEEDFTDPKNLAVAISVEAAEQFKKAGVADPASHFQGKTIRVHGCVMRFEERPYLPVLDPKQISVVGEK